MRERLRRLLLWSGALALTLLLFIPKGHDTPPGGGESVAFLRGKPGTITARIAGDIPSPGVYQLKSPASVGELVALVAPGLERRLATEPLLPTPLADGDLVTVTDRGLVRGSIPARERLALGIPLEAARMNAADWEALPGIGPALTRRIVAYARQRGGIRTADELRSVAGIGDLTLKRLRPLFASSTSLSRVSR